jgi:hypothetical protein
MTNKGEFLPVTHTLALLVYPGFELLDASGPASAFGGANRMLIESGKPLFYSVLTVSPRLLQGRSQSGSSSMRGVPATSHNSARCCARS